MTKKPTIGDCAGGHRIENREKNRDVSIVPRKIHWRHSHTLWITLTLFNTNSRQL